MGKTWKQQMNTGNISDILFINPPSRSLLNGNNSDYYYIEPPLGGLYVYNYFKNTYPDIRCHYYDLLVHVYENGAQSFEPRLREILAAHNPQLVAVSTLYYADIDVFHKTAALVKEHSPDIRVVFGGHYPTHMTQTALADDNVDYLVLGEGEISFAELVETLNSGGDPKNTPGLAFNEADQCIITPTRPAWKGFVKTPRLPWEDISMKSYFTGGRNVLQRVLPAEQTRIAAITATRGCPNKCSFCSSAHFWHRTWRKREIASVIDEIRFLKDHYDINTIVFNDENLILHKSWLLDLLDKLRTLNVRWISGGGLSVRHINDDDILDAMFESGIALFNLAIESGSNATLKKVHKPLTTEETEACMAKIRRHGDAYLAGFFITGFPFDTWKDVLHTQEFSRTLDLDWCSYYCFQPYPGTELYDFCLDNDLMAEFNPNYGEVYFAPDLKYKDFTSEKLFTANYTTNLQNNFIDNRNLVPDKKRLAQAERDFAYVLDMAPTHVFALQGLARIEHIRGNANGVLSWIEKAEKALQTDSFDWRMYMRQLEIDEDTFFFKK